MLETARVSEPECNIFCLLHVFSRFFLILIRKGGQMRQKRIKSCLKSYQKCSLPISSMIYQRLAISQHSRKVILVKYEKYEICLCIDHNFCQESLSGQDLLTSFICEHFFLQHHSQLDLNLQNLLKHQFRVTTELQQLWIISR